jgi:hypothetical protein
MPLVPDGGDPCKDQDSATPTKKGRQPQLPPLWKMPPRYCEERNDEVIHLADKEWIASLRSQ